MPTGAENDEALHSIPELPTDLLEIIEHWNLMDDIDRQRILTIARASSARQASASS